MNTESRLVLGRWLVLPSGHRTDWKVFLVVGSTCKCNEW